MLQSLAAEVVYCYERARQAREKAERAPNDEFKTDFLEAESRWLSLAESYEQQHRLSRTVGELDRRRKAGAVTRMLRERRCAFDPEIVAKLTVAYDAVLYQLRMVDREDGATLLVASRIIGLAALGEHDPERLTAAVVEGLTR